MAATHAGGDMFPSGSPASGGQSVAAGTPQTSLVIDNHTGYGVTISIQIVNGGTGPTLPANVTVLVSADNTTFAPWATDTAGTAASGTYSFGYQLPPEIAYAKVTISGNTAQAVTAKGQYNQITGL